MLRSQCPHIPELRGARSIFGGLAVFCFLSFSLSFFFPPLRENFLGRFWGSSDVTSDGGAAAVRAGSCIPAAQDCFRWGRATSLYLDSTRELQGGKKEKKKNKTVRQRADREARLLTGTHRKLQPRRQLYNVWHKHPGIRQRSNISESRWSQSV